jgi:hypothetical protein
MMMESVRLLGNGDGYETTPKQGMHDFPQMPRPNRREYSSIASSSDLEMAGDDSDIHHRAEEVIEVSAVAERLLSSL